MEVLEKRYRIRIYSTILCSQFDVGEWHSKLGGGVYADAILDRIVPKSHTIKILGDKSIRSQSQKNPDLTRIRISLLIKFIGIVDQPNRNVGQIEQNNHHE